MNDRSALVLVDAQVNMFDPASPASGVANSIGTNETRPMRPRSSGELVKL